MMDGSSKAAACAHERNFVHMILGSDITVDFATHNSSHHAQSNPADTREVLWSVSTEWLEKRAELAESQRRERELRQISLVAEFLAEVNGALSMRPGLGYEDPRESLSRRSHAFPCAFYRSRKSRVPGCPAVSLAPGQCTSYFEMFPCSQTPRRPHMPESLPSLSCVEEEELGFKLVLRSEGDCCLQTVNSHKGSGGAVNLQHSTRTAFGSCGMKHAGRGPQHCCSPSSCCPWSCFPAGNQDGKRMSSVGPWALNFGDVIQVLISCQLAPTTPTDGAVPVNDDHDSRAQKRGRVEPNSDGTVGVPKLAIVSDKSTKTAQSTGDRGPESSEDGWEVLSIEIELYVILDRCSRDYVCDALDIHVHVDLNYIENLTAVLRENAAVWRFHSGCPRDPLKRCLPSEFPPSATAAYSSTPVPESQEDDGLVADSTDVHDPPASRATYERWDGDTSELDRLLSIPRCSKLAVPMKPLNSSQASVRDLISSICNEGCHSASNSWNVAVVTGPPGTGKTRSAVRGMVDVLRSNVVRFRKTKEEGTDFVPTRMLICAPSNDALDEILSQLLADPVFQALEIIWRALHRPVAASFPVHSHTVTFAANMWKVSTEEARALLGEGVGIGKEGGSGGTSDEAFRFIPSLAVRFGANGSDPRVLTHRCSEVIRGFREEVQRRHAELTSDKTMRQSLQDVLASVVEKVRTGTRSVSGSMGRHASGAQGAMEELEALSGFLASTAKERMEEISELSNNTTISERAILRGAHLVFATANSVGHPVFVDVMPGSSFSPIPTRRGRSPGSDEAATGAAVGTFDALLLDEAGCMSVPLALIPISYCQTARTAGSGGRRLGRVVFLGDVRQLPPLTRSTTPVISRTSGASVMAVVDEECSGVTSLFLGTQYRMHPAIAHFPKSQFYGDVPRIRDGVSLFPGLDALYGTELGGTTGEVQRNRFGVRQCVTIDPTFILHTSEDDRNFMLRHSGGRTGFSNMFEVSVVRSLVEILGSRHDRGLGAIMALTGKDYVSLIVISPYQQQVRLIERAIAPSFNASKFRIRVGTVDAFQGQDADCVIFSTVRCAYEHPGEYTAPNAGTSVQGTHWVSNNSIGFVGNSSRTNVALTRARYLMVIVGDMDHLSSKSTIWKNLKQNYEVRRLVWHTGMLGFLDEIEL